MEGGRSERLSTAEAAERLGVKPATLYAYVSRGLLGRERSADGRTSTFDPAEIDRLARPGRARRGRRPAAELLVPSALTAIDRGLPWYRGLAVPELAGTRSFEEVAEWLWNARFPDPVPAWRASQPALDAGRQAQAALPHGALPLERIRVIAAALPAGDELRLELRPAAVTAAGRSLVAGLVDCLPRLAPRPPGRRGQREARTPGRPGRPPPDAGPIAVRLWMGLSPLDPEPELVGVVDAALVLLADHELAASTLAARVAASVRADPYAVASAGLAVVSGSLHGGASLGIEALLDEIDRPDQAASVVGTRLRRGERLRGFGHRLYPDGDPRAATLLARLRATADSSPRMEVVDSLLQAARRRGLPEPNVDLALAALAHVTGMTHGAGEAIFATARTAGWIAHALEEYERNAPIRPRAVYTGPPPGS
ncbi:MAG TPA: citrate/2-methylcitrate synthase [Actinomycetes bacterium]|nr:citrate/2-methylcitrate synthase [Actinomycetes bacterium]